jgi:uncharacterized DUF497 family protein
MDVKYELLGLSFVWDDRKAIINSRKHDGVTFEEAATVFFDPLFRLVDASSHHETHDAAIGWSISGHGLFVVHIETENEFIRIISARKLTNEERQSYEYS